MSEDLHFSISGDDNSLAAALNRSRMGIKSTADAAERESQRMDQMFKRVGVAAAAYLSFDFARGIGAQIIKVTGDMEQLQQSFETMLGSKQAGMKMFNDIKEYAISTPMQMQDLAKGAETLLGFNVEAKKVMPTLKQIGDISRGNADRFNSLTLAFAQMSATGRLMGQDLLQMINGGFNPLSEISKQTGKSISDLKKDMEAGAISTDMVADAFASATAEGGKFHNMLKGQSEKINGLVSTLKDKYQEMLASFGNDNKDVIMGGLNISFKLIENYKEIIDIVKVLVATYGAYKAALIVAWTIEKARALSSQIRMFNEMTIALRRTTQAQILLNQATSANPWGAIAAAIVLVVSSLYLFVKKSKEVNESMDLHSKIQGEYNNKLVEEQSNIDKLVATAKNDKLSRDERLKALNKLKESSDGYLNKLTLENIGHKEGAEYLKEYNNQLEKKYRIEANDEEIKQLYAKSRAIEKSIALSQKIYDVQKRNANASGSNDMASSLLGYSQKKIDDAKAQRKLVLDEINKLLEDNVSASVDDNKKGKTKTVDVIDDEIKLLKKEQTAISSNSKVWDEYQRKINKLESEKESITGNKSDKQSSKISENLKQSILEWDREWSEAMERYNTSNNETLKKNSEELPQKLNDYVDEYFASYNKVLEETATFEEKRAQIVDGWNTKINELERTGHKENANVARQLMKEDLINNDNIFLNNFDKQTKYFTNLYSNVSTIGRNQIKKTTSDVKMLISYIQKESTDLPEGIDKNVADRMNVAELIPLYEQLNALQEEARKTANYPFSGFIYGFEELEKASDLSKKAISETNIEVKRTLITSAKVAKDNGMRYLAEGATSAADCISLAADSMKKLSDASGSEKMKEAAEQMGAMANFASATAQGFATGGWIGAVVSAATSIFTQTIDAFANASAEYKELKDSRNDFLNSLNLLSLKVDQKDYENIFGIASIDKARNAYILAQQALSQYYDTLSRKMQLPSKEKELNSKGALFAGGALVGIGLGKSLTNQYKTLMDAYKKGYTELQGMAIKTINHSGWANFWGAKDKYKSLKDYAPELWDSAGNFDVEKAKAFLETDKKISEEQRKQIKNVIDLKDAYDENMQIVRDDIKDSFGTLGNALTDGLVDSIISGVDAWQEFTKAGSTSLETLGKKIAYSLFFKDKFEKLQKEMEDTYNLGNNQSIGNAQMELLKSFFGSIKGDVTNAKTWMEEWKKQADAAGFDIWDTTRSSSSKGFTSMSQDSGDELNGRFTVIQGHTAIIAEAITSLKKNSDSVVNMLVDIVRNTSRLESIEGIMMGVKVVLDTIDLKGVKIRA